MMREQVVNLQAKLVTDKRGDGDRQDVSSGNAVGAEEGVIGGDMIYLWGYQFYC